MQHPSIPLLKISAAGQANNALSFWALMAFIFILFISPQTYLPALAPLHLAFMTAMMAVMAFLVDRYIQGGAIIQFTRQTKLVMCLLGWAILTLPLSYWPSGSFGVLTGMFLKTLIVYWLLSHVVSNLTRMRQLFWGLSLITLPIALTALLNFAAGEYLQASGDTRIQGYDAPLTGNPNDLALTLNLFLPLTIGLFIGSRTMFKRMLLLSCICLSAFAIITTFSRAGFLTLVVTLMTYLWVLYKGRKIGWVVVALFLAFAALPFLPAGYTERLGTIFNIEADPSGSAQARWGDTLAATKYILDNPVIGAGLGSDVLALNEVRGETWTQVHNTYLQYGVDLGLPGLIIFLILLASCIRSAIDTQRRCQKDASMNELLHFAQGIRVSLVAFSVAAFFHPVAYHFFFYFIAGLALAARSISTFSTVSSAATTKATPSLIYRGNT